MTIYICGECGEECALVDVSCGTFTDEAYGIPYHEELYEQRTACCNSEDFEEVEDDENSDEVEDDENSDSVYDGRREAHARMDSRI